MLPVGGACGVYFNTHCSEFTAQGKSSMTALRKAMQKAAKQWTKLSATTVWELAMTKFNCDLKGLLKRGGAFYGEGMRIYTPCLNQHGQICWG